MNVWNYRCRMCVWYKRGAPTDVADWPKGTGQCAVHSYVEPMHGNALACDRFTSEKMMRLARKAGLG